MKTYTVMLNIDDGVLNETVRADEYHIGKSGCVTFYTEDGLKAIVSYAHGRWMEVKQEN